jgi:hypothetical protein
MTPYAQAIATAISRGWITLQQPLINAPPPHPKPSYDHRTYNREWMRRYRATHPRPKTRVKKTTIRRGDYPRTKDGQRLYHRDVVRALRAAVAKQGTT